MARFAVYKKQTLSEEEVNQKKKKNDNNNYNNDTNYYLRLEIEEDKILKSWKILENIPSRTGDQSQAIMYRQDLPSTYLYVEKSLEEEEVKEEEVSAHSDSSDYEVVTISLWDTGRYKTTSSSTATLTEHVHNGKVELFLVGAKLYGRFLLVKDSLQDNNIFGISSQKDDSNDSDILWYFSKERENDEKNKP